MPININLHSIGLEYVYDTDSFSQKNVSKYDALRYLKAVYTNKERLKNRYFSQYTNNQFIGRLLEFFDAEYDNVQPFTYQEAFAIKNDSFRIKVFSSINISDMITNLGNERISTKGVEVKHKKFDNDGNFIGYENKHNIYEIHKISGSKLGIEDAYAVKCWCTSTNKEHWLWIEDQYKNDPLEAIASTFRIHKNLISNIKELKRQGDILLVEMKEDIEPTGDIVPLTSSQYFELLTAES